MNFKIAFLLIFIASLIANSQKCHYSCLECTDNEYTSCISCIQNQLTPIYPTQIGVPPRGLCVGQVSNKPNILGIFLVMICAVFCYTSFSEQAFYLFFSMQTLGLLNFIEVAWSSGSNYLLTSMNYLMIIQKINTAINSIGSNNIVLENDLYKLHNFYHSQQFLVNMRLIGIVDILLYLLIIVIPLFKIIRKKCLNVDRAMFLPDWILDRIVIAINITFLVFIQQNILTIYYSIKVGKLSGLDIFLIVVYWIFAIIFIGNSCISPFTFFRNKIAQLINVMKLLFLPIFILFPQKLHFLFFIFLILFNVFDILATSKNRKPYQSNRLLFYKITQLLLICILVANYAIQKTVNTAETSNIFGIISTIALAGIPYLFLVQIAFYLKDAYCKTKQKVIDDTEIEEQPEGIDKKVGAEITEVALDQSLNNPPENHNRRLNRKNLKPIMTKSNKLSQNNELNLYILENKQTNQKEVSISMQNNESIVEKTVIQQIKIRTIDQDSQKDNKTQQNMNEISQKKDSLTDENHLNKKQEHFQQQKYSNMLKSNKQLVQKKQKNINDEEKKNKRKKRKNIDL